MATAASSVSRNLDTCSFGDILKNRCHQATWTHGRTGLKSLSELTDEEQKLVLWRSDSQHQSDFSDFTICLHHEKILLTKYSCLQVKCCDPFVIHKSVVKRSLRVVSEHLANQVSSSTQSNIKPGQKICPTCIKKLHGNDAENLPKKITDDPGEIEDYGCTLDDSFQSLGVSPLKKHAVRVEDRISYAKRKLRNVETTITNKVAKTLDVSADEISVRKETHGGCRKCKDLDILVSKLQMKCTESTRSQIQQLLTLAPESWSIKKTAREFKVSKYLVKISRKMKKKYGILAEPEKSKGKALPDATVEAILQFYEDDQYSRMCPGKKDFVSAKINGIRTQKQKRLILINLKELHCEFRRKYPQLAVGFSKFAELRPCWCKTVNSAGSLSVCVCETHQNLKLLANILPGTVDYKQLLNQLVCNLESSECMIHRCDDCPGQDALKAFVQQKYQDAGIDMDDNMHYKQWSHSGQCNLQSLTCTVQELIDIVTESANVATVHHYTAKAQASYLRQLKDHLDTESAIILLDFAENYSFICQDAVQTFHWDTTQATLHPFVVYHRTEDSDELKCISLCVISDDLTHSALTVHAFIKEILQEVISTKPSLKYVHYFSDGAASQYKNCKNLRNLCYHELDFGIKAEWHFFATSHGKSPCDGIGGTVKRLAARASLQAVSTGHILTPLALYDFARKSIMGIKFIYMSSDSIKVHETELAPRMSTIKTVVGTRSHHRFQPANKDTVLMFRLSEDQVNVLMSVSTDMVSELPSAEDDMEQYQVGKFIAVVYSNDWYVGMISERSEENGDVHVKFMKRNKCSNVLTWVATDECWVPFVNILRVVPSPAAVGQSARQYTLDSAIISSCVAKFSVFKQC